MTERTDGAQRYAEKLPEDELRQMVTEKIGAVL